MKTPLPDIEILSIYKKNGTRILLPKRMAKCTPDTKKALLAIGEAVKERGGRLYLSDLFRSYDMQLQSHLDWKSGRKTAFSPPPGGSLHEAGRSCDLDLKSLDMPLAEFWPIAREAGMFPIISKPDAGKDEAWHFDCRGSHQKVYEYYKAGKGTNMKAYTAMAASGILAIGVKVDQFGNRQAAAAIQAGLIRLGHELGNLDGSIGAKTRAALESAGITAADESAILSEIEDRLQREFPGEYA